MGSTTSGGGVATGTATQPLGAVSAGRLVLQGRSMAEKERLGTGRHSHRGAHSHCRHIRLLVPAVAAAAGTILNQVTQQG